MTEVFPKLGGLPQSVIDKMLEKANDGMLLYTPVQKIGEEKRSCRASCFSPETVTDCGGFRHIFHCK